MPLLKIPVASFVLAYTVPVSAQVVDDLDHLSPALPETPRALSANERLCNAIDRYVETHPDVRVAIRLPERTEPFDVQNAVHRQILRYHAAAAYLASIRAQGRSLTANQARAWAAATAPTTLMDLLRRTYRLDSGDGLTVEWGLDYSAATWCRAIRAGREPDPRQAQPSSLVSRFCVHNPFGFSQGIGACRMSAVFGEAIPLPTVYDLRTGTVLPLSAAGTTVFGVLSPSDGSVRRHGNGYGAPLARAPSSSRVAIGYDPERVNSISNPTVHPLMRLGGRLPPDLSALPIAANPPPTTP